MRLTEHTETFYHLKDCPKDCIRICNGCDLLKKGNKAVGGIGGYRTRYLEEKP